MIKDVIANDLDLAIDPVDQIGSAALDDGGLQFDSISIINLITALERKFGIAFDEEEISLELFGSINNLAKFIHAKVDSKIGVE
jgi:acyl carrier protein